MNDQSHGAGGHWQRPEDLVGTVLNDRFRVLKMIGDGAFSPDEKNRFRPLLDTLTSRDWFLVLRDFGAYVACQDRVAQLWRDPERWSRMSILNTAGMGKFSSDRCALEYAKEIWNVVPTPITVG